MRNVQSVRPQRRRRRGEAPELRARDDWWTGLADQASASATHGAANVRMSVLTASCRRVQVRLVKKSIRRLGAHVSCESRENERGKFGIFAELPTGHCWVATLHLARAPKVTS